MLLAHVPTLSIALAGTSLGGVLSHVIPIIEPDRSSTPSVVCLYFFPQLDAYSALVYGARSADTFRRAKRRAQAELHFFNIEPCQVVQWVPFELLPLEGVLSSEYFASESACDPVIIPGDQGAHKYLNIVQDTMRRAREISADDLRFSSYNPLLVLVLTEPSSATQSYARFLPKDRSGEAYLYGMVGVSIFVMGVGFDHIYGNTILINLSAPMSRYGDNIESTIIHEYTHYVQKSVAGQFSHLSGRLPEVPTWFGEGHAMYQEVKYAGRSRRVALVVQAWRDLMSGKVVRLYNGESPVPRPELLRQYGRLSVASRMYAAVSWLMERFGVTSARTILSGSEGEVDSVGEAIARITEHSVAELDSAVDGWLGSLDHFSASDASERITARGVLLPDSGRIELMLEGRIGSEECGVNAEGVGASIHVAENGKFVWESLGSTEKEAFRIENWKMVWERPEGTSRDRIRIDGEVGSGKIGISLEAARLVESCAPAMVELAGEVRRGRG